MSLKPYYFILLVIFLSSAASAILLYYYLNPEMETKIAFSLMGAALFLAGSSFLSLFIFFIKKIYYRGEVYLATMSASIRQAIFIVLGCIFTALLYGISLFERNLILMVWAAIGCLEIMIQAIE